MAGPVDDVEAGLAHGDLSLGASGAARVAIWGSCVTRDAFAVTDRPDADSDLSLTYYGARSSWISQAAAPVPVDDADLGELNGFARRMVIEDAAKNICDVLIARRPDMVVFDLVDERLVLNPHGESWLTDSEYYRRSALPAGAGKPAMSMSHPDRLKLFTAAVERLAPKLRKALPDTRFVIHEAPYLTQVAGGGTLPEPQAGWARDLQAAQEPMFAALAKRFPGSDRLRAPEQVALLDPEHRWGLASYHYGQSYYHWLLDELVGLAAQGPPLRVELGRGRRLQQLSQRLLRRS